MIGAYMTYVTQQLFSAFLPISMRDWYYIAALPLAFAATFLLGAVLEKLVISRLYGREIDFLLLATWGISLIPQQAARSIFGAQGVNVNAPKFLSGGLTVAGCTFSYNRLFILGLVLVCLGGVGLLMYRTAFGRQGTRGHAEPTDGAVHGHQFPPCGQPDVFARLGSCRPCRLLAGALRLDRRDRRSELHRQLVHGGRTRRRRPSARYGRRLDGYWRRKHFRRKLHLGNHCQGYRCCCS